ncbi:amino acid ABC transporter substrate-binding protein [Streptomyces sp. CA-249302]|uniref:amino acid ABC transporter substrate-binding protein n=1 Tax=Streptomyces sp. CA-249302 TaxID=3240058 RepID=UPI003D90A1B8
MFRVSLPRGWAALTLTGALTLGLTACGGSESEGGDAKGPVKVGISLPLTGEASQPGQAAQQGYKVWQKMVNESGGILGRDVKLVIKDDGSNQNTITADYNALISQDKVDLLLGTFSSQLNAAASAVAEKNQMLFVEPAGGAPELFQRGFKYLFFAQQATADKQGKLFAEYLAGLPEDKRPKTAAYPTLDDPFASPAVAGVKKILEAAGIKTVYEKTYATDTKNFDSIVTAMKAADPDVVVHGAGFEDGVGMVRAMLKADLTPKWLYETTAPSLGKQYADGIGAENTEGIMFGISHAPTAKTPGNDEFVAKYKEMYDGAEPPEDAADAYAAGQVLQAAAEGVGSVDDQSALADWLRKNSVTTILGGLKWNKDGSPIGDFLVGQWQGDSVQYVLPEKSATSKMIQGWKPGGAGE